MNTAERTAYTSAKVSVPHARHPCTWFRLTLCALICVAALSGCATIAPPDAGRITTAPAAPNLPEEDVNDRPERLPSPDQTANQPASAEQPVYQSLPLDETFRLPPPPPLPGTPTIELDGPPSVWEQVANDQMQMFKPRRLGELSASIATAAVMANTGFDTNLQVAYQERIRSKRKDEILNAFHVPSALGNGYYTIPIMTGAAALGEFYDEGTWQNEFGHWGQRSFRTVLAGAPALVALQYGIGGARPGQSPNGSRWSPFKYSHGASGHAYMGAIPFLAAAKMTDDPYLKGTYYVASTLAGISRFNDDKHYASQIVLGWCVAYVASEAVEETDAHNSPFRFGELPTGGVGLNWEWSR